MLKILLFGKNGQLGAELLRSLAVFGEVIAPERGQSGGDLANAADIRGAVLRVMPDIVVNAAAFTDVDAAEGQPDIARAINADAPALLARSCGETGAWFVHYSSDYVFDGSGGTRPWTEDDPARPLNAYGLSKLLGDQSVMQNCARHLIFRTSWLYAAHGENFAKKILRRLRKDGQLTVVNDQFGVPTAANWLADLTVVALARVLADERLAGLYHAAAAGETSWHGYACFVVEQAQKTGLLAGVPINAVRPVASTAYEQTARRPMNSRLDTSKLRRTFGLNPPDWQVGVANVVEELA
ncbi:MULTISPECIES: dTDP-4-dehydrorhamnose reductase [Polaromonas]|uniref:dTDP-4-dehydrorhamnose reductase n=1 Tax=Polaromonas aquatica TaxID=332657 RepID=A0ABW1U103_9BURK